MTWRLVQKVSFAGSAALLFAGPADEDAVGGLLAGGDECAVRLILRVEGKTE